MTWPAFKEQMARLDGLKFAPATLDTHWEALSDLSPEELSAAIAHATKHCDEYPSPKAIRVFVDEWRARQRVPEEDQSRLGRALRATFTLPDGTAIHVQREWNYYCEECSDTGMRSFWCGTKPSARFPWLGLQSCGRHKEHGDHEWAEPCPCAATNPDVQRKKLRAQQVTRKQANG